MSELVKPWQLLASRYDVVDPWVKVRADRVLLPNGRVIDPYYIHEYPNWANVLPVTADGMAILIRQYRHGLQDIHLELPCGVLDPTDPDPAYGAARELKEETGYATDASLEQLCCISANPANHTNLCWGFLARNVRQVSGQDLDSGEQIEVVPVPLADLPGLIESGAIMQALHATTILLGLRKLGL